MMASVNAAFCGEAISPGSTSRERTTASSGACSSASANWRLQQRELGLVRPQLSFRLRDVFLAWAGDLQIERLLIDCELCLAQLRPLRGRYRDPAG